MKRLLSIIPLVAFMVTTMVKGQISIQVYDINEVIKSEPIDMTVFTVRYETSFVPDISRPDFRQDETMMLKVGEKSSVYYSYGKYMTDSIIEADKAVNAPKEVIEEHLKQYPSKITYKIYKNYPAGKVTTLDQIGMSKFICEEKNEMPAWEITDETKEILSFQCRKATCNFKGRNWEVWYTEEVPRSEGPWKLNGLPGLILEAYDTQEHYHFSCTGIEKTKYETMIQFSESGYEPVNRKQLNKIYERYAKDPVGFVTQGNPNLKVDIIDENGNKMPDPKDTPFNPVELTI